MLSYYMLISSKEEKGQICGDRGLSLQVAILDIIELSKLYNFVYYLKIYKIVILIGTVN